MLLGTACARRGPAPVPTPADAADAGEVDNADRAVAPDPQAVDTARAGPDAVVLPGDGVGPADTAEGSIDPMGGPDDPTPVPADATALPGAGTPDASLEDSPTDDRPVAAVAPVPILPGALLPVYRIVAFYGNPASRRMGILGELPPDEMLARLDVEVDAWRAADPATPVRPALQIIAVMATGDPGRDSLFRLRMPDSRIREVASWAERRDALLFLDVQPGHSTVEAELEPLREWLVRPDVHLALDPEWAMPPDEIPGRRIGSMSADEINYAIGFLADLVERYHLPPKILVVHRFTASMVRDASRIRRDPRVQVVINMDGWGSPAHKRVTYRDIVAPEADQFTGFKLFFHNDRRGGSVMLRPQEILELTPSPLYIQYQ